MERLPSVRQMQHLSALAQEQHFGRAADVIGVTQSTLSASIKELEDTLGGPVVDRSGKKITLTPLGEMVLEPIQKILAQLVDLTVVAREKSEPLGGILRLGVIPTISPFFLPRFLPALRARYPRLQLFLREDQTAHLLAQLERGELDALVLALPYECSGQSVTLFRDELLLVVQKDHPLAQQKIITPALLHEENLLTLQDGHCLRDQVLSACGLARPQANSYAATSLYTLVQMVDNGLGITLLPKMAIQSNILEGTELKALPVNDAHAWRDIALYWRTGSARAEEMRLLAQQLKRLV